MPIHHTAWWRLLSLGRIQNGTHFYLPCLHVTSPVEGLCVLHHQWNVLRRDFCVQTVAEGPHRHVSATMRGVGTSVGALRKWLALQELLQEGFSSSAPYSVAGVYCFSSSSRAKQGADPHPNKETTTIHLLLKSLCVLLQKEVLTLELKFWETVLVLRGQTCVKA